MPMIILRGFLRWLPAILVMAVIFFASSLPSYEVPDFGFLDAVIKNGGHFAGYALLALAFSYALPRRLSRLERMLVAIALALMYALSDEFHQSFVPGRSPSWFDILIDGLGASTAAALLARYSPNSNSNPITSSES
jgi:VanZ family protein